MSAHAWTLPIQLHDANELSLMLFMSLPHPQTIVQSECIVRGDLANINVGRQCIIGKRAVITPPFKKLSHGCVVGQPFPLHCV